MDPRTKELFGTVATAVGCLDLMAAAFFLLSGRIADPRAKKVVVGVLAFAGFVFLAGGIALWMRLV